jgi:ubiquinone/menaquinone biosynthesis C-methylase UbiE
VTHGTESEQDRTKRHRQRALFDGIAERYEASRPGYPPHVVEFVTTTAGLGPGSAVLEIGCGTGQLTERLTYAGIGLTAIDIAPSMVAAARRRLADAEAFFQVTSFEDLDAADASFDLVISGAAFHWIDPEVAFTKSARLLRPGGWLALLGTLEHYDDPLGVALDALWITHGDTGGAWERPPSAAEAIAATELFGIPAGLSDIQHITLPAGEVLALESTRATFLSWPDDTQRQFSAALGRLLEPQPAVPLTRHTSVTMTQLRPLRRSALPGFRVRGLGQSFDHAQSLVPMGGELGHDPGGLVQAVGLDLIQDLPALFAPPDQPGPFEHGQVLGDGLAGERDLPG